MRFGVCALAVSSSVLAISSTNAAVQTIAGGTLTALVAPKGPSPALDYRHAKPMPMPETSAAVAPSGGSEAQNLGAAGFASGRAGNRQMHPVVIPIPTEQPSGGYYPFDYGTANLPFTTARAAAEGDSTQNYFPFSPAGILLYNASGTTYYCSAALIKPGVVVTAAHCLTKFGSHQFYTGFQFIPAYNNGSAPFGVWNYQYVVTLASFYGGTDQCQQKGVVCKDDVGVLVLQSQNGNYAGNYTGHYGFGWNGYSFVKGTASITQLGYPASFDNGQIMERNNAQGTVSSTYSYNTLMGSLMTNGGAGGGPWLVNFGMPPSISGTKTGAAPNSNIVVGVTSFNSTNDAYKRQGASSFTTSNIVPMVNSVCASYPGAC